MCAELRHAADLRFGDDSFELGWCWPVSEGEKTMKMTSLGSSQGLDVAAGLMLSVLIKGAILAR